jgi:hypothetical protein
LLIYQLCFADPDKKIEFANALYPIVRETMTVKMKGEMMSSRPFAASMKL